jgi:ferrochelatase
MVGTFGCRPYSDRVGVLIAQLGTPDAPTPAAVRRYLAEFLADRRVVEVNQFLWWFILHGIILRTRPRRSARLYSRVWTAEGSPLLTITKDQARLLKQELQTDLPDVQVAFGMRYGNPSLGQAIDELCASGCTKLLLFPMYPQYSAATTGSTYDAVFKHLATLRWVPSLAVVEPYFSKPAYINAVVGRIEETLKTEGKTFDRLLLSYHGIPERYVKNGDPYCCHCTETTRQILPKLSFPTDRISQTFQSRFGKEPWLTPYTDETVSASAGEVSNLIVACPGFTADCLETIDEIGHEAQEAFMEAGGKSLTLVPSLNTYPQWIAGMAGLVREALYSWGTSSSFPLRDSCTSLTCPAARGLK